MPDVIESLHYDLFRSPSFNAELGLAVRGTTLAMHIPSSGGSASGSRNPDRSLLFAAVVDALASDFAHARILACRQGRLDTPTQAIQMPVKTGVQMLQEGFRDGGNFRFDFWLELGSSATLERLVGRLGLERTGNGPQVIWPEAAKAESTRNAWLVAGAPDDFLTVSVTAETMAVEVGDFVALARGADKVDVFARIYRVRTLVNRVELYFDAAASADTPVPLGDFGVEATVWDRQPVRLDWTTFEPLVTTATGNAPEDITAISGSSPAEQAHLRELLQVATMDDLLGPADGPTEDIIGMSVRDRYLVGKLAPREPPTQMEPTERNEIGAGDAGEGDEVPPDLQPFGEAGEGRDKAARRRLPGEELPTFPANDAEEDGDIEVDASKNQSFIPSSIGLTLCVGEDVDALAVTAQWGRYMKNTDHDYQSYGAKLVLDAEATRSHRSYLKMNDFLNDKGRPLVEAILDSLDAEYHEAAMRALQSLKKAPDGKSYFLKCTARKERVWTRCPAGGTVTIPLVPGRIEAKSPDPTSPRVMIQGSVREALPTGDRLVTLFLVNDQLPERTNQEVAWVFQPEVIVRHPEGEPVFRRRPVSQPENDDFAEEEALEMIYRRRVEFGVGHSVAVHATTAGDDIEHATEVRTVIMPQCEVAVTETPGLDSNDRPAMRQMVSAGYLDMTALAEMSRTDLVAALRVLTSDYRAWTLEQQGRVGGEIVGHDAAANAALARCQAVWKRLEDGLKVLETDDVALEAFRFANRAMASQRLHSIYALKKRRGEDVKLSDLDIPKNRSWRPFQLAFVLLSIPALTDPTHSDRTNPIDGIADLIWFPTGGGKTEAYLGVAAFTMAIRRLKPKLGGLDGSRGLSVIMRYTLRLLTLQQFQRATALICAMEILRRDDVEKYGETPFSIGLWVGSKLTPNATEKSHEAIEQIRGSRRVTSSSPAQLTSCPWCGHEIVPGRDIEVRRFKSGDGRTVIYCGDALSDCEFSKGKSQEHGLPVLVVDEEMYRRPPSMLIATVDKFAMMAWKGEVRNLFGKATAECPRHGLLWDGAQCSGNHSKYGKNPATARKVIRSLRPPDLIIQDEFHLISGPLGTMVGLYETAVDELACWDLDGKQVRPKVIASTATVRKAASQVNNVFLRKVGIFPPHGLDIEDNFFSVQRPIEEKPGRRYMGICAPGSARPAVLIRLYTALLTAGQDLFDHFGAAVDPWMTVVGYFNSLRELGGMRRLAEDDVQTRCYRVQMSSVQRPGLAQRSVKVVDELTSRVSGDQIPKKLDQLEVPFKAAFDKAKGKWTTPWEKGDTRAMDVVLATNMLSVGVDVNRIGLMAVNGQPKNTAEYIQATSRVGRAFPGLVCTVLTWSRPRDLSHYETFEHYHATFYRHVEAQSVTPFAARALDRGLTGTMVSWLRLSRDDFNPNLGASQLKSAAQPEPVEAEKVLSGRAHRVTDRVESKDLTHDMVDSRCDDWAKAANQKGRRLGYEPGRARKKGDDDVAGLLKRPGVHAWDAFTVPTSLREVEPAARLIMLDDKLLDEAEWRPPLPKESEEAEA